MPGAAHQHLAKFAAPVFLAAAIPILGCTKEEPALDRSATPSAAPSAERAPTTASKPPEVPCPLRVQRLTFTGCHPQPSQDTYPECTNYELGPATEHVSHGCIPGLLRLAVSGYPGRLDVALVEARPLAEGKIELTVDSLLESSGESGWAKGTKLGELLLRETRVEALILTGALKASSFGLTRVPCPGVESSPNDCLLTRGAPP